MCSSAERSWLIQRAVSRSHSSSIRVITAKSSSPASSSNRQNLARVRALRAVAARAVKGRARAAARAMVVVVRATAVPRLAQYAAVHLDDVRVMQLRPELVLQPELCTLRRAHQLHHDHLDRPRGLALVCKNLVCSKYCRRSAGAKHCTQLPLLVVEGDRVVLPLVREQAVASQKRKSETEPTRRRDLVNRGRHRRTENARNEIRCLKDRNLDFHTL
jgi:hypothetical protein